MTMVLVLVASALWWSFGPAAAGSAEPSADTVAGAARPVPLQLLYPIVDRPHRGVGAVFRNDDLAHSIAPGGRIDTLVSALEDADADPRWVTIVIDPMLLDELDQMSRGYYLLADPSRPQDPLRPPQPAETGGTASATDSAPEPTGQDGAGQDGSGGDGDTDSEIPASVILGPAEIAADQILQRLRALARIYPVAVLPYADVDINATARAGMSDAMPVATFRGRAIASRVLGRGTSPYVDRPLLTDLALPPDGVLTDAAAAELASLGYHTVLLRPDAVAGADDTVTTGRLRVGRSDLRVVLADTATADPLASVLDRDTGGDRDSIIAEAAHRWAADAERGADAPVIILPARYWTPDRTALQEVLDRAESAHDRGHVIPLSLADVGAEPAAGPTLTLTYPESARDAELPPAYLRSVAQRENQLTMLAEALAPGPDGTDPDELLHPLRESLLGAVSASLRSDPDRYSAIFTTIDRTLDGLYRGVGIVHNGSTYTLASTEAPLLLTVHNTLPYQVSMQVQILGGQSVGLSTTGPDRITIDAGPRTVPVKFEAEVRRSGRFTIYAQLMGPHGTAWGGLVPLTIESHAYGTLTLVMMIGAGGVLIVMSGWQLTQRWRARRTDTGDAR